MAMMLGSLENKGMLVSKHVQYRGRVQGVGFRYTTHGLAQGLPVAGFVRNLPDGSVEVIAEGESADVERFMHAIAQRMIGYVDSCDVQDAAPSGLRGFVIRHS